jgi:hypothetical protein
MKILAMLVLSVSLHGSYRLPPVKSLVDSHVAQRPVRKGGRWYLADNGHAVYCYGPIRMLPQPEGGLQRFATFCQGDKNVVPLRD